MDPEALKQIPLWVIAFMVSGGIHEFAHAWAAYKLGDDTAEQMGRLTLNPIPHIDPIGLLMLIISAAMGFGFGWLKPVPVNPYNLRNPKRDMMLISLAGPVSNIIQAALFAGIFWLVIRYMPTSEPVIRLVWIFGFLNMILAAFNLLPIGPLDGAKIVAGFMNDEAANKWMDFNYRYGFMVLIVLIMTRMLFVLIRPVLLVIFQITGWSLVMEFPF